MTGMEPKNKQDKDEGDDCQVIRRIPSVFFHLRPCLSAFECLYLQLKINSNDTGKYYQDL